ncbi:hypothetical protein NHX12_033754 [Muraenolepis orangiensis]|uniref:Integrase zinc-binding domain-containing protein n=1 Tax=Muraenolepis orangiensis TaxID=630683 RepID=A0A9Q0IJ31_9TELE|nr:hypothetical protein NHX12_033754 [Muraenolepis orangiensis]
MRHDISLQNGIMMVGDKIIKKVILEKLHLAHQGIQRTKAKARRVLYWPGMAHDIEMCRAAAVNPTACKQQTTVSTVSSAALLRSTCRATTGAVPRVPPYTCRPDVDGSLPW